MASKSTSTPVQEFIDLEPAALLEAAVRGGEGLFTDTGALRVTTGERMGRSPQDRFIVREPSCEDAVEWGESNRAFDADAFDLLWERVEDALPDQDRYVSHLHAGTHADHYLPLRVTTQLAWHGLYARNMFIKPEDYNPESKPEWHILSVPGFSCDPQRDETYSDAAVIIDFGQRRVLIAGMHYAGEMKKVMFSVQNFLLPEKDVLPMHCAANVGAQGDTTLFFGLAGTGKTTLSTDPARYLIGDDTHGWARDAVFNLEGGCYAKTVNLDAKSESSIRDAIGFGTILENVAVEGRHANYQDTTLTSNGRCCYPLSHVRRRAPDAIEGEATTVVFLCCDVSGVMPLIATLSPEAAVYHFLSGYTALVGSTETGVDSGFHATFSACYGGAFLPRRAADYAELLVKRIDEFDSPVYLLNTGWMGDPAGSGSRVPIAMTREAIAAAESGALADGPTVHLDVLNLDIPREIPGVTGPYLNPRDAWGDPSAYEKRARMLAHDFQTNFARFDAAESVVAAGPRPGG